MDCITFRADKDTVELCCGFTLRLDLGITKHGALGLNVGENAMCLVMVSAELETEFPLVQDYG